MFGKIFSFVWYVKLICHISCFLNLSFCFTLQSVDEYDNEPVSGMVIGKNSTDCKDKKPDGHDIDWQKKLKVRAILHVLRNTAIVVTLLALLYYV